MFMPLLKPLEITGHVIIALLATAWIDAETVEFEKLTESKVESTKVSIEECEQSVASTPA